jgi:oligopeptidase A
MSENPFLSRERFPRFDELTPEAAREALPALIAGTEEKVAALEKACEPTWDGRVAALTDALEPFSRAWHLVGHMLGVRNSDAWRAVEEELQPAVVRLSLRVAQSRPLYDALLALRDGPAWASLDEGRRRVVESAIRDARDAGVGLDGPARERFLAIATRLSELSTRFSNNTLDATKAFALDLADPAEVAGLPPAVLALCADAWNAAHAGEAGAGGSGEAPGRCATPEAGPWRVTLEISIYSPFQQYAERRDLREKLYRARAARASSGATDNTAILSEILALRREQAALLGFPTYARLALDSRMAKTPEAVYAMFDRIGDAALPRAREELDALRAFAAENGAPGEIRHWDLAYWSRRRLEALYGYSSETLRPYLPFPRVLDGLFGLARELFGVAIEPCDGLAPVWHPDVRLFRVRDAATGADLAHFYLDPYSRPAEKQGGAWMDEICNRAERPDGSVRLPLALLCCNQAPPSGGKPSLMTLGEVDTLFHEFGHALQGMLTRVGIPEAAGIANVEWDAVELASQFLENWHDLPAQLHALSAHVDTGEPIPEDLVARIQGAKTYNQGLATVRQLRFALVDMDLHERVPCEALPNAEAAWAAASARFALLPPLPEERFLNTFTHIFSGGYAAGYYSYMWADILAHDAFAAFEEAGLDDPSARAATGRRYAATILALGGSRAPADVFRDFRGRDPTPDALLRHKGLA